MSNAIELQNVTQEFTTKRVLSKVNLAVQEGEILGLLGPSGAGKTTIVKILTGQLKQTSGKAMLLGKDTRNLGAKEYQKIGTMMDNFGLYDRFNVYDNLKFYADVFRVPRAGIDTVLDQVGLLDAKKTTVARLSKGMRSRLCLARAVLNDAKVLFLDEPTTGLDPATTREIHKMLMKQKQKGTTIFLTTHNMYEAEHICDNVALLHQGSLVEYGRPGDICKKYNHQNKLHVQLKDGRMLEYENACATADEIRDLMLREQIASIHSTEPDLESVFIELTGKGLD